MEIIIAIVLSMGIPILLIWKYYRGRVKDNRIKDICTCVILWATLFFLLPGKAVKSGLIKNKFIAWLVAFMSPPVISFIWFFTTTALDTAIEIGEFIEIMGPIIEILGLIIGILGLIISCFNQSNRLRDTSICIILWVTLFFLLPRKAQKSGIIKSKTIAWLSAFLSPLFIVLVNFVLIWIIPIPLSKYQTPFTSHEEIVEITGISNFPKFKYKSSKMKIGPQTITIKYIFKDDDEVEDLHKTLNQKVNEGSWSIDSTNNYHYERVGTLDDGCIGATRKISIDINSTGFQAHVEQIGFYPYIDPPGQPFDSLIEFIVEIYIGFILLVLGIC